MLNVKSKDTTPLPTPLFHDHVSRSWLSMLLVFQRFERLERSEAARRPEAMSRRTVERFERARSPWTGSAGGQVDSN